MSKNFRKTAVLKKIEIVNQSYKAKDYSKKKLGGVPVLKFLKTLALDIPYICL